MIPIPLKVEVQIRTKVKQGKAPPCADCAGKGTLAGVSEAVVCTQCGAEFKSLKHAWRKAWQRKAEAMVR